MKCVIEQDKTCADPIVQNILTQAHEYACMHSGCSKVKVGSVIINSRGEYSKGCNRGIGYDCIKDGCRRVKLYGENSKEHRLPSDCNSIHSEVDAIGKAAKKGICTAGAAIYVTRYPCESCARAIVAAGISTVYYGRSQKISEYTKDILNSAGIKVYHVESWSADDTIV